MVFEYFPNKGFQIGDQFFNWGEDRESVRQKLKQVHKADDRVIEMAEYFDGDESQNIETKKDIYQDIAEETNYFFLSYDKDEMLSELEIHWGIIIKVEGLELQFEKPVPEYVEQLERRGFQSIKEEDFFFPELKMVIADNESTGGEGNGLSYFYAAKNVDHLFE